MRPIRVVCWSLDERRVLVCWGYVGSTPLEEWLSVEWSGVDGDDVYAALGGVRYRVGACDLIPVK